MDRPPRSASLRRFVLSLRSFKILLQAPGLPLWFVHPPFVSIQEEKHVQRNFPR